MQTQIIILKKKIEVNMMVDQICTYVLYAIQRIVQVRRTTISSLCVLHFLFSLVAIFANTLAIRALWKASSLPDNLRKLLLSLAFSDLGVGLFAQLMIAVVFRTAVNQNGENLEELCPIILTAFEIILFFLVCVSFLNVTAIAVDRLLAISLHLRYEELMTAERVLKALVAIWLVSFISSLLTVVIGIQSLELSVVFGFIGFLLTSVAYFRVYKVARYHQNQIHNQFDHQNGQERVLFRERKCALGVVYIYVIFVVSYLPHCSCLFLLIKDNLRISFLEAQNIALFFVFLNSSLNPLVYCWRFRQVREIMKSTLRKILRITAE